MCMNMLLVIMAFCPLFGLWPSSFFLLPRDHGPRHFMLQNIIIKVKQGIK